jgi:hypothetical protein
MPTPRSSPPVEEGCGVIDKGRHIGYNAGWWSFQDVLCS